MQKIIVTGGLGFRGSNLVRMLVNKKYFVIKIDKISYASNFYNLRDISNNNNYKFIKCDLKNRIKIYNILKNTNLSVYLIWQLKHM